MVPDSEGAVLVSVPTCLGWGGAGGAGPGVAPAVGGTWGPGASGGGKASWPVLAAGCWYGAHAWSRVGWLCGADRFVGLLLFFSVVFFCWVSTSG